jgi:hypothetical protein
MSPILPARLPGYEKAHLIRPELDVGAHVALAMLEVQVYLRSHDYFMSKSLSFLFSVGTFLTHSEEMSLNIGTTSTCRGTIEDSHLLSLVNRNAAD